jgi:hypothetical protein
MKPAAAPPLDTKKEHPLHKYPTPDAAEGPDPERRLQLPQSGTDHRRVLAVLAYLQ